MDDCRNGYRNALEKRPSLKARKGSNPLSSSDQEKVNSMDILVPLLFSIIIVLVLFVKRPIDY